MWPPPLNPFYSVLLSENGNSILTAAQAKVVLEQLAHPHTVSPYSAC